MPEAEHLGESDFEGFFEAEYEPLLKMMHVLCRNRAEAQDLAQEAMARAFERWNRVARASSPRAYVYAIALNLHRSALRRAALAIRHRHDAVVADDDPETVVARRQDILLALRSLPRTQLEAVLLVEWLGLTSQEAGTVLGIDPDSVRGRVHRARVTLRERFGGSSDG